MSETQQSSQETANADDAADPFYRDLPNFLSEQEMAAGFRLTNKGVFVSETSEQILISSYQKWLVEQTGKDSLKNEEKCRKRLYGEQQDKTLYLIDGKRCLVGKLLRGGPQQAGSKDSKQLPVYRGEPVDPLTFLHTEDPIFKRLDFVSTQFIPSEGLALTFSLKQGKQTVSLEFLKTFAEVARQSLELKKRYPKMQYAIRECIKPLYELLERARPKKGNDPFIIPSEAVKKGAFSVLATGPILFVLNKDKTLIDCLLLKGRSGRKLLKSEIAKLETQSPLTSVRGFTTIDSRGHSLGKVRIKGISYLLEPEVLTQYLRSSGRVGKKFDRLVEMKVVLQKLVGALQSSKEVPKALEDELNGGRRVSGKTYRVAGALIFVIADKKSVQACFVNKKAKPSVSNETNGDKPKPAKKRRRRRRKKPNATA